MRRMKMLMVTLAVLAQGLVLGAAPAWAVPNRAYVANINSANVSVIDAATNTGRHRGRRRRPVRRGHHPGRGEFIHLQHRSRRHGVGHGTRSRVSATLTCPAGEVFRLGVVLTQAGATGSGSTRGTCTGEPQPVWVRVTTDPGPSFTAGDVEA